MGILITIVLLVACTEALSTTSRARFFSSAASAFGGIMVWGEEAQQCDATSGSDTTINKNPRYLETTLEMKYGESPDGNPRTRGVLVRRFTGDSTPFDFPVKPIRLVKEWPSEPPFSREDFFRTDNNDDGWFYKVPKLVYHIDERKSTF